MSDELLRRLGEDLARRRERVEEGEGPPELVSPLTTDERESVLDGAFARLAEEPKEPEVPQEPEVDRVVPMTPKEERERSPVIAIVGVVLAVAAALLLWWGTQRPEPEPELIAALPEFSISRLAAGPATHRAGDDEIPESIELRPDDRIELTLTPAQPVREPVGLVIVARGAEGGPPILVRPERGVQVSPNGAIRIQASLSSLVTLSPGEWTLELLVGPTARLPDEVAELSTDPPPWRSLTVRATVLGPS